jgi:hypothetical protein
VWSLGSLATVPLIVFVVCALAMPQLGYAATFEVNNTADIVDANPGEVSAKPLLAMACAPYEPEDFWPEGDA